MKNKGGRGKKAGYSTIVMRVPAPLKSQIEKLIEEYLVSLDKPVTNIEVGGVDKPVTSIESGDVDKPVTGIEAGIDNKPVTGIESNGTDKPVTGIEILNLPKTTYMAIKGRQINTVAELKAARDAGVLAEIKNIGKVSIKAIEDALAKL